jgi:hypothetical protein
MKLTPIQELSLLVAIQTFLLVVLLAAHLWIHSQNIHLLNSRAQILAQLPGIRQKFAEEQNPEKIRSEALGLLDLADQGNQTMIVMEANLQKMNDAVGLVFFMLTAYLGVCVFKLQRQNQDGAAG